ncbi:YbaY family lipoprotein [Pseudomonas sp. Teo4]|uniref:YbaY family lipoprotein n=1 Tax=Pseudomonas sp. Teo4 TaxID=3064528 RepID=UPI002ABBE770|nr:YbaY family lipoprotein [Pseudomonas sp. Teo4]MDZ3996195.1 hypothetical protein [Pseudomonas sp. Teo4]
MPRIKSLTVEVVAADDNQLPLSGQLHLSLYDDSLADAPENIISELRLRCGELPITLELPFEWSQIDQRHTYALSASVLEDGQLQYFSSIHHPVEAGVGTYRVTVDKIKPDTNGIHDGNHVD